MLPLTEPAVLVSQEPLELPLCVMNGWCSCSRSFRGLGLNRCISFVTPDLRASPLTVGTTAGSSVSSFLVLWQPSSYCVLGPLSCGDQMR